jgi:hypothetical protein
MCQFHPYVLDVNAFDVKAKVKTVYLVQDYPMICYFERDILSMRYEKAGG